MANDTGSRYLVREEHGPGRSYELFTSPNAVQVHVDGVSAFMVGPALARIEFHEVSRVDDNRGPDGQPVEIRELKLTLVIPMAAFTEFMTAAIKGIRDSQERITEGILLQAQAFKTFASELGGGNVGP